MISISSGFGFSRSILLAAWFRRVCMVSVLAGSLPIALAASASIQADEMFATPALTSDETVSFVATADARIEEANPRENFGINAALQTDKGDDPQIESYLRFSVSGLSEPASNATLHLSVADAHYVGSVDGPDLYISDSNLWSESRITGANKPVQNLTFVSDIGQVDIGDRLEVDVSSVITGNGQYTFVLVATSEDMTEIASRESANAPQLVVSTSPPPATTSAPSEQSTVVATPIPSPTVSAAATPVPSIPVVLNPVADARVLAREPDTNFGLESELSVNQRPREMSFLRFEIPPLTEPGANATLRLRAMDGTVNPPDIAISSDTLWDEQSITWLTRPDADQTISSAPEIDANTWLEYDVSDFISSGEPVTFALVPQAGESTVFASRESGTHQPELVINQTGTPDVISEPEGTPAMDTVATPVVPGIVATPVSDSSEPSEDEVSDTPATPVNGEALTPSKDDARTGIVANTGGLNLRCRMGPSLNSTIILVLPPGEEITTRGPQEGNWIPVDCRGEDGYVAAAFIEFLSEEDDSGN